MILEETSDILDAHFAMVFHFMSAIARDHNRRLPHLINGRFFCGSANPSQVDNA